MGMKIILPHELDEWHRASPWFRSNPQISPPPTPSQLHSQSSTHGLCSGTRTTHGNHPSQSGICATGDTLSSSPTGWFGTAPHVACFWDQTGQDGHYIWCRSQDRNFMWHLLPQLVQDPHHTWHSSRLERWGTASSEDLRLAGVEAHAVWVPGHCM